MRGSTPRAGVILPTFTHEPDHALEVAEEVIGAGVHGLFCYDHIWPMGRPDRPALAPTPVLSAVAARFDNVVVGTLVARIGLVPDEVLLSQLRTLQVVADGRLIAGLGIGDEKSEEESRAYGLDAIDIDRRRERLVEVASRLLEDGIDVWLAGASKQIATLASELGVALNRWGVTPGVLAESASIGEVTWAGLPPDEPARVRRDANEIAKAGATWVVYGWPVDAAAFVAGVTDHPL